MNVVAITQRVIEASNYNERRDALDQRWISLLREANISPLILPNHLDQAQTLLNTYPVKGIILTGGNDLAEYGGDAPERDALETWLLQHSYTNGLPLLGVCRGMQMIFHSENIKLVKVENHVCAQQTIEIDGQPQQVNSYHHWAAFNLPESYRCFANAKDNVIKAIQSNDGRVTGIMWHPERITPFRPDDIQLLQRLFLQ